MSGKFCREMVAKNRGFPAKMGALESLQMYENMELDLDLNLG